MRKFMILWLVILVVFFTTTPWTLAHAGNKSMKVTWRLRELWCTLSMSRILSLWKQNPVI